MNPKVVRRGAPEVLPPPWACDQAEVLALPYAADGAALMSLCNRLINGPAGRPIATPAVPAALLTVQSITGFHSLAPEIRSIRYDYLEANLWVLVKVAGRDDHFLTPYVLHQDTVPTAVGRELWGFPKELARVDKGQDIHSVQVLGYQTGERTARWQNALSTSRAGLGVPAITHEEKLLASTLFGALLKKTWWFFFLREFGSPAGTGCDVQQIVEVPMDVALQTLAPKPQWLDRWRLNLPPLESHPIESDLGLAIRGDSLGSLTFECEFVLQPGMML